MLPLLLLLFVCQTACSWKVKPAWTRAGVAIGIETRHRAWQIARAIAVRADAACGTYPIEGPLVTRVSWSLVGEREGQQLFALEESRSLEVDGQHRARFHRRVSYRYGSGTSGEGEREWRLIEGRLYVKDHNLPFEQRQVDVLERSALLASVAEVFETLVRATGERWTGVITTAEGFELAVSPRSGAGQRVRCGNEREEDPWLAELIERVVVARAVASVTIDPQDGTPRLRQGEWWLERQEAEDLVRLRVEVSEEIQTDCEPSNPIEPPSRSELMDLSRDRLYWQLEDLLQGIDALSGPLPPP
ncbi:MAG: hypothetical protein JW797_11895 [Bradymonadales bacterium]|nr:hypothetical protein [Bradymonadales bacterium]